MSRATQHRAEFERRHREYWPGFKEKLEAVDNYLDAKLLAEVNLPMPDSPGRAYHTNFGWFLGTLKAPGGASCAELGLYKNLLDRLLALNRVDAKVVAETKAALDAAISSRVDEGRG